MYSKRVTVILYIVQNIIQTERNKPKYEISGFRRDVCWKFVTDFSGRPFGLTFKGEAVCTQLPT
jgi:NADH:ubiquinone oxidoreductase subunit H